MRRQVLDLDLSPAQIVTQEATRHGLFHVGHWTDEASQRAFRLIAEASLR